MSNVAVRADLEAELDQLRTQRASLRALLAHAVRERDALLDRWPADETRCVYPLKDGQGVVMEWRCYPSSGVVKGFKSRREAVRLLAGLDGEGGGG